MSKSSTPAQNASAQSPESNPVNPRVIGVKTPDVNSDGQKVVRWTTGKIPGHEQYALHKDGSVRHAVPQFKGSKKDRRRFKQAIADAVAAKLPERYRELGNDEKFRDDGYDQVYDLNAKAWVPAPFHGCTVSELRRHDLMMLRGATPDEKFRKTLDAAIAKKAKAAKPKAKRSVKKKAPATQP